MPGPGEWPAVVAPAAWRPLGGGGSRRPTRGCEDAAGEKMEPERVGGSWPAAGGPPPKGHCPPGRQPPGTGLGGGTGAWGSLATERPWSRPGRARGQAAQGLPRGAPQGACSPHRVQPRPPPCIGSGTGEVPLRPSHWPSDPKSPGCSGAQNHGRQAHGGLTQHQGPAGGQVRGYDGNSPKEPPNNRQEPRGHGEGEVGAVRKFRVQKPMDKWKRTELSGQNGRTEQ